MPALIASSAESFPTLLRPRDQDFVRDDQFFELIQKSREGFHNLFARAIQSGPASTRQPPKRM